MIPDEVKRGPVYREILERLNNPCNFISVPQRDFEGALDELIRVGMDDEIKLALAEKVASTMRDLIETKKQLAFYDESATRKGMEIERLTDAVNDAEERVATQDAKIEKLSTEVDRMSEIANAARGLMDTIEAIADSDDQSDDEKIASAEQLAERSDDLSDALYHYDQGDKVAYSDDLLNQLADIDNRLCEIYEAFAAILDLDQLDEIHAIARFAYFDGADPAEIDPEDMPF